jgi:hypothetical protein
MNQDKEDKLLLETLEQGCQKIVIEQAEFYRMELAQFKKGISLGIINVGRWRQVGKVKKSRIHKWAGRPEICPRGGQIIKPKI